MASVAGRYASALFELSSEFDSISEVERDLDAFQRIYDESADLRRMVRSPVIPSGEQVQAIAAVLGRLTAREITVNFFQLVARNRRLFAAPDMVRAFRALAAKSRGEVTADVVTAVALSDAQVRELKDTLKASVGKDVQLATRVDQSLLGGLIVKMGSRMVDSSLRTKLANMKAILKAST